MKTSLGLLFLGALAGAGCSSAGSGATGSPDAQGASSTDGGGDAAAPDSGSKKRSDGGGSESSTSDAHVGADAPPTPEAGPADGGLWAGTTTPPGYSLCGNGTFKPSDFIAGCSVASSSIDIQMLDRDCDAATVTGGQWEAWCGTKATDAPYVRVEYDGLSATGKYPGCMGFTEMSVVSGWIDANGGGSGMTAPGVPAMFDVGMPVNDALQSLGNTQPATSGTGNVFLIAGLPGACSELGPQAVIGGVAVSWK